MARCRMRYGRAVALAKRLRIGPVVGGMVRGGTGHRVDLILPIGRILHVWPDGDAELSTFGVLSSVDIARDGLQRRLAAYKVQGETTREA